MQQKGKVIVYYIALAISVLAIMLAILGVAGTMVSIKYDTLPANPCISTASSSDLCRQMLMCKFVGVAAVIAFIVMLVFKDRMLAGKKPRQ